MIVAGLYDGNIAVYNLQKNKGKLFSSMASKPINIRCIRTGSQSY